MTPERAVRQFCVGCVGSAAEVRGCGGDHCLNGGADDTGVCLFWRYRLGHGRISVKTIGRMCRWCMGGDAEPTGAASRVRECADTDCALWSYRMGRNPAFLGRAPRGFAQTGTSCAVERRNSALQTEEVSK